MKPTVAQVEAYIEICRTIAEAVKEAGEFGIPSGHVYAMLIGTMSLQTYEGIIDKLKGAGLIREDNSHLLYYVGIDVKG